MPGGVHHGTHATWWRSEPRRRRAARARRSTAARGGRTRATCAACVVRWRRRSPPATCARGVAAAVSGTSLVRPAGAGGGRLLRGASDRPLQHTGATREPRALRLHLRLPDHPSRLPARGGRRLDHRADPLLSDRASRGEGAVRQRLNLRTQTDPEPYIGRVGSKYATFHFHPGEEGAARLTAMSVAPEEVTCIVNSHRHYDP